MTTKIKSGVISDNAITSAHISSGAISSGHLSSIDTDAVSEGSSNLYFTTARARTSLSVTDSGGDGSLAYDNSTGAITYTGPSAAEVRAHISVTDSGGDGSLAYSNGVITYVGPSASEVRAHLSAGTGVTYSSGAISIGQSVATTASPTFADINITGDLNLTGDINSYSVTDLDIVDQTITLGAGQNEAASDGSGIVIAGSSASILWDEPNDEFDFNKSINVTGNIGVSGTVDGVDIAARDAILTSTTTTAGAALPKAGGTMSGALIVDAGNSGLDIRLGTDKRVTWSGGIGEIGSTAGFQAINTAGSALAPFGIRATELKFATGSETRLTIDASGNVGIGETDPDARLEVKSSGTGEATGIRLTDTSGTTRGNLYFGGSQNFVIHGASAPEGADAPALQFATGGITPDVRMTILEEGNVGIGTTNPQFALDVTGLIRVTNDVYLQGDVYINSKIRHNGDVDNYITFSAADTQGFITGNSTRLQITNSLVRFNQENNNQDFSVYSANSDNMLYVDASTDRVGIGTDSPDADLHVEGVTRTKYLRFQNLTDATSEVAGMYSSSGGGTNDLTIYASALSSTSSNIEFLTAPTNSATTTTLFLEGSSGNVGIGTTSPGDLLHLNKENGEGKLRISRGGNNLSTSTSVGSIDFYGDYNSSPTLYGGIDVYSNALSNVRGSMDLNVKSTSGNALTGLTLYGTNAGVNVGIGTTAPDTLLELRKDTASTGYGEYPTLSLRNDNAAGYSAIHFQEGSTQRARVEVGNNSGTPYMGLYTTSAASGITIKDGNVGVGLTDPLNKFVVAHASHGVAIDYVGATLPYQAGLFTSSSALTETAYGDLNIKSRSDYTTYGIGFFTANVANTPTRRMRINAAGDVQLESGAVNKGYLQLSTQSNLYALFGGNYWGYLGYKTGGYHRWFGSDAAEDMRINNSGDLEVQGGAVHIEGRHISATQGAYKKSMKLGTGGNDLYDYERYYESWNTSTETINVFETSHDTANWGEKYIKITVRQSLYNGGGYAEFYLNHQYNANSLQIMHGGNKYGNSSTMTAQMTSLTTVTGNVKKSTFQLVMGYYQHAYVTVQSNMTTSTSITAANQLKFF